MRMIGREELRSVRIADVLENLREFGPVKAQSQDDVPRLDFRIGIEVPGKEGA
jgi:hypothetical protein